MAILEELQEASFRGAVFFMTGSTISGGRKDAKKELVNSDAQVIEDLGLRQPTFSLGGIVSARVGNPIGQTYKQMRDALLDALQSSAGPGQLIHPFYGSIDNVVCRSFTINESPSSVGIATLTMNFEISNTLGTPEQLVPVLGTISTQANVTEAALETELAKEWEVTEPFTGNFADAVEKTESFIASLEEGAEAAAQELDKVDQFAKFVSEFAADTAALVADAQEMAEQIRGGINSLNGLFQTIPDSFNAMKALFDFGDLDIRLTEDTAGGAERQKNRDLMNSQVQGSALVAAYVLAAQLDLPTVEDIDATQTILEDQFQKMSDAGALDRDSFDALTEARITLSQFFNSQRATKPRRVGITTHTIPARVLAYSLYGSSEQGTTIAELNEIRDDAFVEGEIEILSS